MPIDLTGAIYADYKLAKQHAERLLETRAFEEAATAYLRAAKLMEQYAGTASDVGVKKKRLERAAELRSIAEKVRTARVAATDAEPAERGGDAYRDAVLELITRSKVTWDQIAGLDGTIAEIKAAYALSLAKKPAGVDMRGWRNILFYGPPGTGKTLLAAATSTGLEATFFNARISQIISKYFGESSKLISALYDEARRHAPSVIFLDEFEALTPQRGSDENGAERRIVTTLLAELDGLAGKSDDRYVLTICATNLPGKIDAAILSRFERKIFIPLPDAVARRAMLDIQLSRRGYRLACEVAYVVEETQGYSGREIERLCRQAIARMVERANSGLAAVVDRGKEAVTGYTLRVEPLTREDLDYALKRVRPETTAKDLAEFEGWRQGVE